MVWFILGIDALAIVSVEVFALKFPFRVTIMMGVGCNIFFLTKKVNFELV